MASKSASSVPTYSMAERDRRWSLARKFMDDQGLDALFVYGEHEDAGAAPFHFDLWFTNGRPGTTVIFPKAGEPLSLLTMPLFNLDHMESSRRGDVMWISPKNIRPSRSSDVTTAALKELGLTKGTIGVVGIETYPPWHPEGIIPYRLWNTILKNCPDVDFRPVAFALAQAVMPQSQEEIAVTRYTASVGDAMVRAMVETAGVGVPESEVYAAGMAAGYVRGAISPAMHFWSGPDPVATGWPQWGFRPQAPRTLQNGDVITSELFCQFGGRHTQHQVVITIGDVHKDFERAETVARAAYDAGLRALRPGRTFGEFAKEMCKPLQDAGGWIMGPAVHGLNPLIALSGYPADINRLAGAESYPKAEDYPTVFADMKLEPGMSFAFEPNYAFGRHVVHVGGTVIVGGDEALELSPYTAKMLRAEGPKRVQ